MTDTLFYAGRLQGRVFKNDDPKIRVLGIGAAGTNIVNALFEKHVPAELVSINTDWKQLSAAHADKKLLIGLQETQGLGCGGDVIKGRNAAKESLHDVRSLLDDTELIFLVGGLGNGTATGGLPIIAKEAKKRGALVVAFLIVPLFMRKSDVEKTNEALKDIELAVDTAIVLDHNKLHELCKTMPLTESFRVMNNTVATSMNAVLDLIRGNELFEINFAHIRTIFQNGGFGTIGMSVKSQESDLEESLQDAIQTSLFYIDPKQARAAAVHVEGGSKMSLRDVHGVAGKVKAFTADDAQVVMGLSVGPEHEGKVKTTVILTGIPPKQLYGEPKGVALR